MARDTAACNRAIRQAWERERELVIAGKGTRNWTPEQRDELITKGKVYDADGKAFIGQHMKSASGYPEYQGDVDNIQLLSLTEHLEAHKGNWHNVTNWYYDPDTKEYFDFNDYDYNDYPPVITLDLSESIIYKEPIIKKDSLNNTEEQENISEDDDLDHKRETETYKKSTNTNKSISYNVQPTIHSSENKIGGKFKGILNTVGKKVKAVGNKAKDIAIFAFEHPEEVKELATAITDLINIGSDIKTQRQSNRERTNSAHTSKNRKSIPSNNKTRPPATVPTATKKITPDNKSVQNPSVATKKSDDLINRTSPKEHTVKAHQQRYHTKEGIKVVDKDSFSRGGKKKDED